MRKIPLVSAMTAQDRLYADLRSDIEAFVFDDKVAAVFADMIRRSVPGYANVIASTGLIAAQYVSAGARIVDLGCSLGASLHAVGQYVPDDCTLIGVDNSAAMLSACEQNLANLVQPLELVQADMRDTPLDEASLVILNYTLQFLGPGQRQALINRIYTALKPGGALIVSEKIHSNDVDEQQQWEALHSAFKRHNGYSELEISQKRAAIENVLVTDTPEKHIERLNSAGFSRVTRWFQCLNFMSFLALK